MLLVLRRFLGDFRVPNLSFHCDVVADKRVGALNTGPLKLIGGHTFVDLLIGAVAYPAFLLQLFDLLR